MLNDIRVQISEVRGLMIKHTILYSFSHRLSFPPFGAHYSQKKEYRGCYGRGKRRRIIYWICFVCLTRKCKHHHHSVSIVQKLSRDPTQIQGIRDMQSFFEPRKKMKCCLPNSCLFYAAVICFQYISFTTHQNCICRFLYFLILLFI